MSNAKLMVAETDKAERLNIYSNLKKSDKFPEVNMHFFHI